MHKKHRYHEQKPSQMAKCKTAVSWSLATCDPKTSILQIVSHIITLQAQRMQLLAQCEKSQWVVNQSYGEVSFY